ncbi:MAG: hypothetical protein [Microviridae sp.]|nr:MAG: hypothetical protein [Microviridae sp.]
MKKTLGGDRLGAGNKMTVDTHHFERSTHDTGYIWRSTMSAGTLVPFMHEVALPGDTIDIHLNCDIKTHPTIGPLFGSYKVQLDVFTVPMRLYHSALHNNRLGIGMNMAQIKLPKVRLNTNDAQVAYDPNDYTNTQIHPSCIFAYLGIRGVGTLDPADIASNAAERSFNAIAWLAYWEIYKNYYANKQEEIGYVITKALVFNAGTTTTNVLANSTSLGTVGTPVIVNLTYNDVIHVDHTGAAPDPDSVFIQLNDGTVGNAGRLTLREITIPGSIVTESATRIGGVYNFAKFGNKSSVYWTILTSVEQVQAPPRLEPFPLEDIDKMRDEILQSPWNVEFAIYDGSTSLLPYAYTLDNATVTGGKRYQMVMNNQEGLGVKTYQSDLFNNWLSTEWLDGTGGVNEITAIDTSSGTFSVESFVLAEKVYKMLNDIAVSGGSYNDWIGAVYDHEAFNRAESPVYMGGLIKELTFQEVVSNSAAATAGGSADNGGQPLGTLAGKGVMSGKHKGGTVVVSVSEPSYIMGIISLTPRIDYSQGNKWDVNLDTLDDLHKPHLDQIGFQELITEQMAWWTTQKNAGALNNTYTTKSAGKQPAWINYMTNVNEVHGNFAIPSNEGFMVLTRRYEPIQIAPGVVDIKDLTTYIDPVKFNHIFAETSLDAQNFWTQISVDMTSRRKMSAKLMPNL